MPLIMGILAQGVATPPAAAASYDLLETEILTGSQTTVTFSNLNSTYGSTYQHLQLRMTTRSDYSTQNYEEVIMQFNGDTASNYALHELWGNGSSVYSGGAGSQTRIQMATSLGNLATANAFAAAVVDILDPFDSSKNTTVRSLSGREGGATDIKLLSGFWNNTAALTSILLDLRFGTNFVTGCRFSLYGLKASA